MIQLYRVDVDHSGSLDFPEFLRFYQFQVILFFQRNLSKPKLTFLCCSLMNGMMTGWDPSNDLRYLCVLTFIAPFEFAEEDID